MAAPGVPGERTAIQPRHSSAGLWRRFHRGVRKPLRSYVLAAATAAWLIATVAGMVWFVVYSRTPGDAGTAPATWPGGRAVSRNGGKPTLVLALHPACTCSQATLEQLGQLTASHPETFEVVVLFASYDGLPADADVIGPALARHRDIRRVDDRGAAIASRFGALTSGHALLYDEAGRLRFSGGLTRSRGEAGDSVSLAFLHAWADGTRPPGAATFSVFGCALASHGGAS
jgi:hypothetical protein